MRDSISYTCSGRADTKKGKYQTFSYKVNDIADAQACVARLRSIGYVIYMAWYSEWKDDFCIKRIRIV